MFYGCDCCENFPDENMDDCLCGDCEICGAGLRAKKDE